MNKVGFIGVGIMGKSMVRNLMKAGFELHIYARTKSKVEDVISEGAQFHESIKDCVQDCDAVITIVGFPQDVEEVYFDEGNILDSAKEGAYLIDMTTTSPQIAEKIYAEGTKRGFHVMDAPVTGGDTGAKAGTLSILVGGEKEDYEACMPLFEAMGTNINYQGKAGCGQHCKLANQIMIAGTLSGVCEALTYAKEQGLDPEKKATESRYKAVTYAAIGGKQENLNLLMQGRERLPKWTWSAACSFGSRESVQCLLAEGYQPTEWDCYSAYTDCTESVFQELLKRDIPYDVKNQGDGVLEEASEAHVERLLAEGAKPTVTTLERAIEWRNDALIRQIVKELKTQKVDLSTKGCSALENAIAIGDLKSVRYLVKQGVAINAMIADVDCDYTPMHVAAQSPSVDILKFLIENGGDIQIKDGDGKTPYDYAKEMKLKDNMELLKP